MSSNSCQSTDRSKKCPSLCSSESEVSVSLIEEIPENSKEFTKVGSDCFFLNRTNMTSTRTESISKLRTEEESLQQQIENIELDKSRIKMEIRGKKSQLVQAIMKVVEFEKDIQSIEALIAEKLHHFQSRVIDLETKRMEIFLNSGDGKVQELLEREIEEIKQIFQQQLKKDESERDCLTQQAQTFAATLGDIVNEYQIYFDESIEQAEGNNSFHEMLEMRNEFNNNITQLHRLKTRPGQFCTNKDGDRFFINENREIIFKAGTHSSEYKLNVEGHRIKVKSGFKLEDDNHGEFHNDSRFKIYTKYFFEDKDGRFYIDVHANRVYKADSEASEYRLINGKWRKIKEGTYAKDERGLRIKLDNEEEITNEIIHDDEISVGAYGEQTVKEIVSTRDDDLNYIKATVGTAIRKALAAVAVHKPVDPINYFANFLLNYRYYQFMFETRNNELKHFTYLREKLKE